jgi:hypothetical protein
VGKRRAVGNLAEPEPDLLGKVSWDWVDPSSLLSIDLGLSGEDIDVGSLSPLGSLDDLPEGIEKEEDSERNMLANLDCVI